MRQIIEILRLKYEAGLSHERIARACGLSKGVVGKYLEKRRQVQGVTWPLPKNLDEAGVQNPFQREGRVQIGHVRRNTHQPNPMEK